MRLGSAGAMQELTRIRSEEEVWARWLACRWVRRFERGQCGAEEFASGVVSDWGLAISPSDFLERFSWWAEGLFDGAVELVSAVRDQVRVGCLSNTNAIHWARGTSWGLDQLFDLRFLSHELGLVKPDQEIFEHISSVAGYPNERVVFLDDNAINVDQARSMGFQARQANGVDQARAALIQLGVLTDEQLRLERGATAST